MRTIAFHQSAFDQYNLWALRDKKTFERLTRLIAETARTPFAGIGKPEPLKTRTLRILVTPDHRRAPARL
jgi:toxin YoeB